MCLRCFRQFRCRRLLIFHAIFMPPRHYGADFLRLISSLSIFATLTPDMLFAAAYYFRQLRRGFTLYFFFDVFSSALCAMLRCAMICR